MVFRASFEGLGGLFLFDRRGSFSSASIVPFFLIFYPVWKSQSKPKTIGGRKERMERERERVEIGVLNHQATVTYITQTKDDVREGN